MKELHSAVVGLLTQESNDDGDYGAEAPLGFPFFDGLPLIVRFMDLEAGEENAFIADADDALTAFQQLTTTDRRATTKLVFDHYLQYVQEGSDQEPLDVDEEEPDGIWRFVHPLEITLSREHGPNADMYVQVECHCDWDLEDGLQLVFRRGRMLTRVAPIDGHLTDTPDGALMNAYQARYGGTEPR